MSIIILLIRIISRFTNWIQSVRHLAPTLGLSVPQTKEAGISITLVGQMRKQAQRGEVPLMDSLHFVLLTRTIMYQSPGSRRHKKSSSFQWRAQSAWHTKVSGRSSLCEALGKASWWRRGEQCLCTYVCVCVCLCVNNNGSRFIEPSGWNKCFQKHVIQSIRWILTEVNENCNYILQTKCEIAKWEKDHLT